MVFLCIQLFFCYVTILFSYINHRITHIRGVIHEFLFFFFLYASNVAFVFQSISYLFCCIIISLYSSPLILTNIFTKLYEQKISIVLLKFKNTRHFIVHFLFVIHFYCSGQVGISMYYNL